MVLFVYGNHSDVSHLKMSNCDKYTFKITQN